MEFIAMSYVATGVYVSTLIRDCFAVSVTLGLTLAAACGGNDSSNQGEPETNGTTGGAAGAVPATGGVHQGGSGNSTGGSALAEDCQGNLPSTAVAGADHSVTVDGGSSWGELPHFWNTYGTGHLGLFLREDRGWGETLRAHVVDGVRNLGLNSLRQHGLFHEDIGIYREENGTPVYDFTRSDEVFDFFVEQGIEPIVELGGMPRDLARDPAATVFDWESGISPPRDFALWQELVRRFVEHSVERYGAETVARWYFEVWNEPECCGGKFWSGTLDEYFELYDHSAAAVRAVLPNGRVGGPVASQPIELTQNSAVGELFLQHVTTDNYLTPGTPGVLDFFAYHSWSFVDGAVNGYFQGLDLLDSFGVGVSIALTEFGPTWQFNLYDEPQETAQGAAFVAQTYADIAQRCAQQGRRFPITYAWWVLSDIFEEETYREDEPFIGCMGLTSRENIRKPAYNAYKFLAQMGNEQIALSVDGLGDVGGMAARDANGGVQILVYNAQNPGLGSFDGVYYEVTDAHEIGLTVSGLNPELPYDLTAYRVDDTHGNAYATWEAQGRPTMSEMSDSDWAALRDTMDSPAEPLGEGLCGATFTQSFSLPSPGVLFVTLSPSSS
jgi:xylan 1,4-beta-xylosidase